MRKTAKLTSILLLVALVLSSLAACAPKDEYQFRQIFAMDTAIGIYINASEDATELIDECESLIYSIENVISKTKSGSDVYRLNAGERVECNAVTLEILKKARSVYELSGGAFDPTVAGLVSMWKECEAKNALPSPARLEFELSRVGFDKVNIEGNFVSLAEGAQIDLGGIGKGYSEEAIALYIKEKAQAYGVRGYMLDFGGMVAVFGEKANGEKYNIGIKDPNDTSKNRGKVRLESGFVSVSGDYERFFTVNGEKYHHIIDPKTGYPSSSGIRSATVICQDGALADALSTALFVLGYDKAIELYQSSSIEFEAVFFLSNGDVKFTPGADYVK